MADLQQLKDGYRDVLMSLRSLADELEAEDWERPTGCPGWSVRDNLAHIVGIEAVLAGEGEPTVEVPDRPHITGDASRYMETHVEARRGVAIEELVTELEAVTAQRLAEVDAVGDLGDEVASLGGSTGPAAGVLSLRIFDMYAHEQDMRRATGHPGHLEGPATAITLKRILRGLTYYLPQRVEGMGGTFRVDIEGRPDESFGIDLSSGDLLTPLPEEATVTLRCTWSDLVALACGRADAPGRRDLDLTGPGPLVDRLLLSMAVTP